MKKHPTQPILKDAHGTLRFKENKIVSHLLDFGQSKGCGLNEIAMMPFSKEDRKQLAQLIGYSVGGYCELSYVNDDDITTLDRMIEMGEDEKDAKIRALEQEISELRKALQKPMAKLFGVHPDDLSRNIKE